MEKEGKIRLNKKVIIIGISITIIVLAIVGIMIMLNTKDKKEVNECEVIFDSSGGTKIETVKILKGGVVEEPITPEKKDLHL